jgi:CheB methylesterase
MQMKAASLPNHRALDRPRRVNGWTPRRRFHPAQLTGGPEGAILQHLNAAYVTSVGTWLAGFCSLPVKVAEAGDRPQPGIVYIAGDDHLQLNTGGVFVSDSCR